MSKVFFIMIISLVVVIFSIDFMNHHHKKRMKERKRRERERKHRKERRQRRIERRKHIEYERKREEERKSKYEKRPDDMVYMDITAGKYKLGRVIIKLFSDVTPKTCENFKVLCSNRKRPSYRNSIFHRVVKGFMIQGGDFTNHDGSGGYSIYGEKFQDENFKIKHNKAGLLSMANAGPHTNGSQFFITLGPAPHLNGKHVVFGEVVKGMKIVRKIGSVKTKGNKGETPITKIKIKRCGLYNGD